MLAQGWSSQKFPETEKGEAGFEEKREKRETAHLAYLRRTGEASGKSIGTTGTCRVPWSLAAGLSVTLGSLWGSTSGPSLLGHLSCYFNTSLSHGLW